MERVKSLFAVLVCFVLLFSIVASPLQASKYACDKGMVKCMIAALLSGEFIGGVGAFCVVGYAICEMYY